MSAREPLPADRLAEYHDRANRVMANCRMRGRASLANVESLKNNVHELAEELAFLHRNTLPELRRTAESHKAGKKRWRERAEAAEAKLAALAQVRVWRNEDGKGFLFSDDVAAALGIREQEATSEAEHRARVLREAANALAALGPADSLVSASAAWSEAIESLRRMADEAGEVR